MAKFVAYEKTETDKRGRKKKVQYWYWNGYVGTNPNTGKKVILTRRGFKTQKKARDHFDATKAEFKENYRKFNDPQRTFESVANDWLKQYSKTVQESSYNKVADQFRLHIIPEIGAQRIGDITVQDCQNAVDKWFDGGFSKYHDFTSDTSRVFKYAINIKLIKENPMDDVIPPRAKVEIKEEDFENYYETNELKKFLSVLKDGHNEKAYALLRLLAFTGLRKGEALALCWSDIDTEKAQVHITKAVTRDKNKQLAFGPPKNQASRRVVDIDPITLKDMQHWKIMQAKELLASGIHPLADSEQLVFSSETNYILTPSKPRKWIIWNAKRAGVKYVTPHGFRHTHASLLFESGATIKEVQQRLGHSSYETTANIYTHVTKKKQEDTGVKFAKYVNF